MNKVLDAAGSIVDGFQQALVKLKEDQEVSSSPEVVDTETDIKETGNGILFSSPIPEWGLIYNSERRFTITHDYISWHDEKNEEKEIGHMKACETIFFDGKKNEDLYLLADGREKRWLVLKKSNSNSSKFLKIILHTLCLKTKQEMKDIEYLETFNPAVPFLWFPLHTTSKDLRVPLIDQPKNESANVALETAKIMKHFVAPTLQVLLPFSNILVSVAIKMCEESAGKATCYFSLSESAETQIKNLKKEIGQMRVSDWLGSVKANVEATKPHFQKMLNISLTLEMRAAEVTAASGYFVKILHQLKEQDVFRNNALIAAPFVVKFAEYYSIFAAFAGAISPHYVENLVKEMKSLKDCINVYCSEVLKERLSFIKYLGGKDPYASTSLTMIQKMVEGFVSQAKVDGKPSKKAGTKFADEAYPMKQGPERRVFYGDDSGCPSGCSWVPFAAYKEGVRKEFEDFFSAALSKIEATTDFLLDDGNNNGNGNGAMTGNRPALPYPIADGMMSPTIGMGNVSPPYPTQTDGLSPIGFAFLPGKSPGDGMKDSIFQFPKKSESTENAE